jgi:formate--tetrahydrofolate ligase
LDLARAVLAQTENSKAASPKFTYPLDIPLNEKIEKIAQVIYGAGGVDYDRKARNDLELLAEHGYDNLPICIAKTPLSFSDNAKLKGRPTGFKITVNELRVSAGAGFVVAICGNIMTMPGLPKEPVAARIVVHEDGSVSGLS